jgi:putative (di)nucleoside polyphosphate hydrolase
MSDVIDSDGFRANVGIILMRGGGGTFLGRQLGGRGWQFPQGGVLAGEAPEQAAFRERRHSKTP